MVEGVILKANIAAEAIMMTDEASHYANLTSIAGRGFTRHGAGQYVD